MRQTFWISPLSIYSICERLKTHPGKLHQSAATLKALNDGFNETNNNSKMLKWKKILGPGICLVAHPPVCRWHTGDQSDIKNKEILSFSLLKTKEPLHPSESHWDHGTESGTPGTILLYHFSTFCSSWKYHLLVHLREIYYQPHTIWEADKHL